MTILENPRKGYNLEFLGLHEKALERDIDEKLRHPHDNPTIGIILCRSKQMSVVEYALCEG